MKRLIFLIVTAAMLFTLAVGVNAEYRFSPGRVTVEPVVETSSDGVRYFGSIFANGRRTILPLGALVLTDSQGNSFPDRSTLSPSALETLEAADARREEVYHELEAADNLTEIFGTDRLDPNKDYAVTALFSLTPVNEGECLVNYAFEDGGTLDVKLEVELPTDREYYFGTVCEDSATILDDSQVEVLGNGQVELSLTNTCPIVLIEEVDGPGPGPEPEPDFPIVVVIVIVLLAAILVVCILIFLKKCCKCRCKH